MNKAYERINWENKPSTATKLNATNLNKMDLALDTIDDRVIDLDTNKADKSIVKAGNPITFNITDGGVFDKAEVDFSPIQDLHGYDNPWVGGAGKNKCALPYSITNRQNVSCVTNSDGSFTLTGTTDGTYYAYITNPSSPYASLPTGTYTMSVRKDGVLGSIVGRVRRYIHGNASDTEDTSFVNGVATFTMENDDDKYLVYIGPIPANVNMNGTYYPQLEQGLEATPYEPYENICPITGYTELNIFQSNGSTTTPDETYTQSLGATYYGGTYDFTTGKLTVDKGIVDLGSLTWESAATSVTGKNRFQTAANVISSKNPTNNSQVANIKCSDYIAVSANNVGEATQGIAITTTGRLTIFDDTKSNYTGADFKTAMSGVQLAYELATPTETTLTPTQISALIGDNVMWTDGDKVTVRISILIDSEYVSYDNTSSGLTATNVQDAIDELKALISALGN